MTSYERGYQSGLNSELPSGLANPAPMQPGRKGYVAWHDGYRDGRIAKIAIDRSRL